ncbi:MAG: tryptophan--tRNA ligase [Candidatus Omnitrophica bacterium]|nr:tryptophan--tRNA ligase [Candidatus Omnitrophota bacterium]
MKKRILSGMRPTGKLHLGHLVGALGNWVELQDKYDCLFMVADWHALMSEYESPKDLGENVRDNVIDWLACGISPQKSTIFIQSRVKEHLELYAVLSIITPLGWLERCPTYKEQLREVKGRDLSTYGFLGYPVLQAADILVYKAQAVPVGGDQLPHLELTREIARKFNNLYKEKVFPDPEAVLTKSSKLLGTDGRKMSKSYNNTIAISESPEDIRVKIQKMFTDPARVRRNDPGHPEKCNLHSYYTVFAPGRSKEIAQGCREASLGCTDCKKELAQELIRFLEPIQKKRKELLKDKLKLDDILDQGAKKASVIAEKTMSEVKKLINI